MMKKRMDPPSDLGFWIKKISNQQEVNKNRNMSMFELTASQIEVILFLNLNRDAEINQVDLEEFLHCSNPTVTGLVKRLEAKGFLIRQASTKDKRYKVLKLTDRAIQYIDEMEKDRIRAEDASFLGFTEEERNRLLDDLQRIYKNLCKVEE